MKRYFLFNKPFNTLCQFTDSEGRKTLKDIVSFPKDVYPVGRLDYDSEGLLILSNDKSLVQKISHPRAKIEKEYYSQIENIPVDEKLTMLQTGVMIEDIKTKPAKVKMIHDFIPWERFPPIRYRKNIPDCWLSISITEGRNRQIRKMTAAIGHPTLRLIRIRIGNIFLDDLLPGDFKEVKKLEIE